jgi:hypothetical protein
MLLSRGVLPDSNTGANWRELGPKKYGVSSDPNPEVLRLAQPDRMYFRLCLIAFLL